jgi:hypothetical protein
MKPSKETVHRSSQLADSLTVAVNGLRGNAQNLCELCILMLNVN